MIRWSLHTFSYKDSTPLSYMNKPKYKYTERVNKTLEAEQILHWTHANTKQAIKTMGKFKFSSITTFLYNY